jgi:hypothetical protein
LSLCCPRHRSALVALLRSGALSLQRLDVSRRANQTSRATAEITTQIGAIQETSFDAVKAIQGINATIAEIDEIACTVASAIEE